MQKSSNTSPGNNSVISNNLPVTGWTDQLNPRLKQQLNFLVAVDALKNVTRAGRISDQSRHENSAEHSWHLTLFARVLAEYSNQPVNVDRVVMMLMVHDIVEIDAGDMPLHGPQNPQQAELEAAAAQRIFGLLPSDQADTLKLCWEEFEQAETADAQFAKAVDRLQPVLLNMLTNGGTWTDFDVSLQQVSQRTAGIERGSTTLWQCAETMFEEAVNCGWLKKDPPVGSS